MSDYSDGQNILNKRPEPGRQLVPQPKIIEKEKPIDVNAIADAVVKAIGSRMSLAGGNSVNQISQKQIDDFDNIASLDRLAKAMVGTGKQEGNIDNIGRIKETKKDEKETKNTIDMLSQLGD